MRIVSYYVVGLLMLLPGWMCMSCGKKVANESRADGWYHVYSGQPDSLSATPIATVDEFASLRLDTDAYGRHGIYGQVNLFYFDRWAAEIEKAMGKKIAFVMNDSVIVASKVTGEMEKLGRFIIGSPHYRQLKALCDTLNRRINFRMQDSLTHLGMKKLWAEARAYKATITDTTFLQTKGTMSYAAIDMMNGYGLNPFHAYNQVVYLTALDRFRSRLTERNGRLVMPDCQAEELYMSDDLLQFIKSLFKDWNLWIKEGRCRLVKDERGFYTVEPVEKK